MGGDQPVYNAISNDLEYTKTLIVQLKNKLEVYLIDEDSSPRSVEARSSRIGRSPIERILISIKEETETVNSMLETLTASVDNLEGALQ